MKKCSIETCNRKHYGHGWCMMHWRRWRKNGDPNIRGEARGQNRKPHPVIDPETGYVMITRDGKHKRQHRLIMERILGRPLLSTETVHHKNGVRHDNRRSNLELWSSSQPPGQRVEDKLAWAREIIDLYA